MFERNSFVSISCFYHLVIQFVYVKTLFNCIHYERRTFAAFRIEKGDYEKLVLLCLNFLGKPFSIFENFCHIFILFLEIFD